MISLSERPILITGVPKSGTSLVAGIVAQSGAWTGKCYDQEEFQPRGYFENIIITCCTWQAARAQYHWGHKMSSLLPALTYSIEEDLKARWGALIPTAMWSDGYEGGLWMYKLPQTVFFWPIWAALYPNAQWVTVHRTREKIAESMARNWGETPRQWRRLARLYSEAMAELEKTLPTVKVQANDAAEGNVDFLKHLDGVQIPTQQQLKKFVVKNQWHR